MDPKDRPPTPVVFSDSEADAIREAIRKGTVELKCPRCGGEIKQTTAAGGHSIATVWEMGCRDCNRTTLMQHIF